MEYLILDEYNSSLTRGILRNPPTADILEFEIPESDVRMMEGHTDLEFVGFDEHSPSFLGTVTRRRGNRLAVKKGALLGDNPLDAIRAPYVMESFAYPVSGTWQGRSSIVTEDLSCGAVKFTCKRVLAMQEVVEVALAVREGAMLVHAKIIVQTHNPDGSCSYVGKFISGVEEVEQAIRKEVMYLQLKQRDDKKDGKVRKELFRITS